MSAKHLILCLVICFYYLGSAAQQAEDFYSYCNRMDAYYDNLQLNTPDSLKIAGMKDYQHWKDFWQSRVDNSRDQKGNLNVYGEKIMEAWTKQRFLPDSSSDWLWQYMGPVNLETHNRGIITSLYVNPDNVNEIYAGSNSSGMFKTMNGGANWECVTDNLDLPAVGINDIAVDPADTRIKYLALNPLYRSGPAFIYKTSDDCKSWRKIFTAPTGKTTAIRIIINPEKPSILYSTIQDVVYRSMDSGETWELIFDGLTCQPDWYLDRKLLAEIEFKPGDPDFLIIASTGIRNRYTHDASGEIWFTTDAVADSVSWTRIETGLPEYCDRYSICSYPSDYDHFLIGYSVGKGSFRAEFNVDRLEIPGLSIEHLFNKEWWQNYSSPFSGMGYWCNGFECSPVDPDIVFVGGYSLQVLNLKSKQYDFYRFGLKDKDVHVDQRVFKVIYSHGKTFLFSGNDGGITRFDPETGTFKSCNGEGLNNLQFYRIGHSELNPDFLIGGTQDNGVLGNANGQWNSSTLGDAYEVIVDPLVTDQVFVAATGGSKFIARSVNKGRSFFNTPQPFASGGLNNRPFLACPLNSKTLYIGYNELFKTENQGLSWEKISDFQNKPAGWNCGDAIGAVGLTEADINAVYAGFVNPTWGDGSARLFRTSDGGQSWTNITGPLEGVLYDKGITGITVSPFDPGKCWVSFNGYAQDPGGNTIGKVMYSADHGETFSDISATLPDLPVNCITGIEGDSTYHILVGNDLGIFMYDDKNGRWGNICNGLPQTLVTDIEVNHTYGYVIAGTFGRGIWRSKIPAGLLSEKKPETNPAKPVILLVNDAAANTVRVEISNELITGEARLIISDCNGRIVLSGSSLAPSMEIDVSRLAPGLYILHLFNERYSCSRKFIRP